MKIKLSKKQWELVGKKAGWIKKAQIIPDDGIADGGEPYTDEEMDLMEKENGVTIFKLIEDWKDQGYGIALISPSDIVIEPYIDPSDYPDMVLDKSGNGARVIDGKYKGYLIMFHSGQFEDKIGQPFSEDKRNYITK